MAGGPSTACGYPCILLVFLGLVSRSCYGFGSTFGFDIHHRFSDPVKGILGVDDLPEKGSVGYYVAMAHRDRIIRARHLAASDLQSTPLTFANGNDTHIIGSLGYLHYANVSVGTPSVSFLVALDTGSDLFWLPCDCKKGGCVTALKSSSGSVLHLNIYSPTVSSTSENVSCNSSLCGQNQCSSDSSNCDYRVVYLSSNTSSTGILVEDLLHLVTDDDKTKAIDANITFGCGQSQTGTFLEGAAPNGLFGLGMDDISVPSTLARDGKTSNSFAIPTYNISITQITVGRNSSKLEFSAIFDSGTSFTSLTDPAYTFISEAFTSQVQEKRHSSDSQIPFEYCYDLSANQTSYTIPDTNLTMKGGDTYFLNDPTVIAGTQVGYAYCLGLLKSEDINIIGQNFMTGYNIIFDREKMVLGWKDSDCYKDQTSASGSPAVSPAVSPAIAVDPVVPGGSGNNNLTPTASPSNDSPNLKPFTYVLMMLLVSFFSIV
ncbi:Aspartic proteinase-like protein 1 [Morella rubra]|uniref:Aspartic proteinase-like protein 1 n=1 Tax=Morella rubra TaxID=262757 RepID=A0A6A1UPN4_9ROSI|nr:Aspartic proteinase-like protein 1 [Morella rubra]